MMNPKILQQLKQAKNKDKFMMSVMPEDSQILFRQFQQLNEQEQAQKIADYCNKKGITKEQLKHMINGIN